MLRRATYTILTTLVAFGAVAWIARSESGSALGPVIALTPDQVTAACCYVQHPGLSGRGETAAVHDLEVNRTAFVHLDDADTEPMEEGYGNAVSGDGCSELDVRRGIPGAPPPIAVLVPPSANNFDFVLTNRCTGTVRTVWTIPTTAFQGGSNRIALSHDARFAAIEVFTGNNSVIARLDTANAANLIGMPPAPLGNPDAEFGLDISDDGRIIVVTVTNFNQYEVAAWDVNTGVVALVSAPNGPIGGWASYPSVSGNGRWVAYASSRPRAGGEQGIGPWIFVTDRANGSTRLASTANVAAYGTSLSSDATQVAYSVGASGCAYNQGTLDDLEFDCLPIRIDVAFGPQSGFTGGFQTETVSGTANGTITGDHRQAVLSGNGRWVAWVSDAGRALMGSGDQRYQGRHAYLRRRDASISVSNVNFGSVVAPGSSSGTSTVTNTGRSTVSIATIAPSPGAFAVTGGTCAAGVSLPPGATCSVNLRFNANGPSTIVNGLLTVSEVGFDPVAGQGQLSGLVTTTTTRPGVQTTTTAVGGGGPIPTITQAPTTTLPGATIISATPDPLDFGDAPVLIATGVQTLTVHNTGTASGDVVAQLGGANPGDFELVGGSCTVGTLLGTSTCTLDYRMTALASGARTADLVLTANGSSTTVRLTGIGRFEPRLATSPEAVTERGIATIIGQGFPPGEIVTVHVDETVLVLTVIPGAEGMFRLPLSPLGRLELGSHDLRVDDVPTLYVGPTATLIVVLPTFSPQGPTGPAFNNSLLVARG